MSLIDYVQALETCPDDDLSSRFGITHDWPVLVKLEGDALLTALTASDKWSANEDAKVELRRMLSDAGVLHAFDYDLGSVQLHILPYLHAPGLNEERVCELEREGYKTTIWVADSVVDIHEISEEITIGRARAMVVRDLANLIIEHRIPARFPHAHMGVDQPKDTICYEPE
ncbi:MAG: hypothetical protein AABX70_00490 [Nanoarchaeota archaeon]